MGLFDRIKGDTEEVELRVPRSESDTARNTATRTTPAEGPAGGGEGAAADDDDDERFLLPGMQAEAVQEPEEDEAVPDADAELKELLGRIVEQNERIIRLLEDGEGDDTDAGIDGVL